MVDSLAASYRACGLIARSSASSFYFSFRLLPLKERRAMHALYAFLRLSDDIADDDREAGRLERLRQWRGALQQALSGRFEHPIFPALADTVAQFAIPPEYLFAVLDGVEMDLDQRDYATFAELSTYCHRVASVVGLACIHIWGFTSPQALEPARQCGLAMQLTNILRDLDEDLARGRVYLPLADLERFNYRRDELLSRVCDDRFRALMRFQILRAEQLFEEACQLAPWLPPHGRRIFYAMFQAYRELLAEIKRRDGQVFGERIRLSRAKRLKLAFHSWLL